MNYGQSLQDLQQEPSSWQDKLRVQVLKLKGVDKVWRDALQRGDWETTQILRRTKTIPQHISEWVLEDLWEMMDVRVIEDLIAVGYQVIEKSANDYGRYPIHMMVRNRQQRLVEHYCESGWPIDVTDYAQETPLEFALNTLELAHDTHRRPFDADEYETRKNIFLLLLNHPSNHQTVSVSASYTYGYSLAHKAPLDTDVLQALLSKNVPLVWQKEYSEKYFEFRGEEEKNTILGLGHEHILSKIFEETVCPQKTHEVLSWAQHNGFTTDLKDEHHQTLLIALFRHGKLSHHMSKQDHLDKIQVLLDHGYSLLDIDPKGNNVWHALFTQPGQGVQMLFDYLYNNTSTHHLMYTPNHEGVTPIQMLEHHMDDNAIIPGQRKTHYGHSWKEIFQSFKASVEAHAIKEQLMEYTDPLNKPLTIRRRKI